MINEGSRKKEDEYFMRLDIERMRKQQEELKKQMEAQERQRLKDLHYMHCPKCGMHLTEVGYKGINVDKCFSCEGVWLDAGELHEITKLEKRTLDKIWEIFKP
ncbi:MAG: hypothetical protein H6Q30_2956 [Bacteroidetes bacterium]|jgi:hypothetical protein|nr:hypothetical protein [Bacteroidota bacterium]